MITNGRAIGCKTLVRPTLIKQYYDDIKNYKILSKEEELALFKIIRGDNKSLSDIAKNKLIESNQRFIVAIAKTFSDSENLMDLISEGNIGLMEAIETFDENKNVKFLTWAVYYMKKNMILYLIRYSSLIRNYNTSSIYSKLKKEVGEFFQTEERLPMDEEISHILREKYNINIKDNALSNISAIISIDNDIDSDDAEYGKSFNTTLEYNNKSSQFNSYENNIESEYINNEIKNLLSCLNDRDKKVISMLYGIGYDRELEISEVADEMKMSKERIRQLQEEIINKMKFTLKYKMTKN